MHGPCAKYVSDVETIAVVCGQGHEVFQPTVLALFCGLAVAAASCSVYRSSLLDENTQIDGVDRSHSANTASDRGANAPTTRCGNGYVDVDETCDVAIAHDEPGACVDSCVSKHGCYITSLVGTRCNVQCADLEISAAVDDDGCCPTQATAQNDNDCPAECGNGIVEHGEACDPPEKCPQQAACVTKAACMLARHSGSAQACTAKCTVQPIVQCESGDGCCPTGCSRPLDEDCDASPQPPTAGIPLSNGAGGSLGMPADAGAPATGCDGGTCDAEPQSEIDSCVAVHAAGRCQACDCAHCPRELLACATEGSNTQIDAALALIDCATQHRCSNLDCFCGDANLNICGAYPLGACVDQIHSVAGSADVLQVLLSAISVDSTLGKVSTMLSCRAQHCSAVCGLQ
ncbi:MAG: hypothetical protein RL701_303 [Pseudomonadota bacterium]